MQVIARRGFVLPPAKYSRSVVLTRLRDNLTAHKAAYAEAVQTYRELATEYLDSVESTFAKAVAEAKEKLTASAPNTTPAVNLPDPRYKLAALQAPVSYADAYEQVIDQLTNMLEDVIELDDAAYQCFMMDRWEWKAEFDRNSAFYASNKRAVISKS